MNKLLFGFSLLALFAINACKDNSTRVFEKNIEIEDGNWNREEVKEFEIEIPDSSLQYNLLYNIRNTSRYPYYNLYLSMELADSSGNRLNLQEHELYLFDPSTGKPAGQKSFFGKGSLGDIYDQTYPAYVRVRFPYTGKYTVKIKQFMRNESFIPHVLSVGLRVNKSK